MVVVVAAIAVVAFLLGLAIRSLWPVAVVAKQETDDLLKLQSALAIQYSVAFSLFTAIRNQPKLEGNHLHYWSQIAKEMGDHGDLLLPDANLQP